MCQLRSIKNIKDAKKQFIIKISERNRYLIMIKAESIILTQVTTNNKISVKLQET